MRPNRFDAMHAMVRSSEWDSRPTAQNTHTRTVYFCFGRAEPIGDECARGSDRTKMYCIDADTDVPTGRQTHSHTLVLHTEAETHRLFIDWRSHGD